MKILISDEGNGAHHFERIGIAKALSYCRYDVRLWTLGQTSAFDIFHEFEPELLITQNYNIDDALYKCIVNRPGLRVVSKTSDWSDWNNNWSKDTKEKYPVLLASNKEKRTIFKLREECGKPDVGFIHYEDSYLEQTHGNWIKNGLPIISLKNGADLFEYCNGQYDDAISSQVLFIGNFWPYKSVNLTKFLLPLCNPNLKLKLKVFGGGQWSIPQYMGPAPQHLMKNLFKSAAVNLSISEPHSTDFGYDITEKIFKLTSNKSFAISDYVEGMEKIYGNSIEYAKSGQEMLEKTLYYLSNPDKKMSFIKRAYDITIANHTYFERVISIFDFFGLDFEINKVKLAKERLIKELSL